MFFVEMKSNITKSFYRGRGRGRFIITLLGISSLSKNKQWPLILYCVMIGYGPIVKPYLRLQCYICGTVRKSYRDPGTQKAIDGKG